MADAEGKKRTFRKYSYRCGCPQRDGARGAAGPAPGAMGMVAACRSHGGCPPAPAAAQASRSGWQPPGAPRPAGEHPAAPCACP